MKFKNILLTLLIAFLGGAVALTLNSYLNKTIKDTTSEQENIQARYVNYSPENSFFVDFTLAAEKSVNAVVHVKTYYHSDGESYNNPLFEFFFGDDYEYSPMPMEGSGSGVIITKDGYIVTNNHVIEKSKNIKVILNDKRSFKAKLIGSDPTTDIALLKIEAEDLPTIEYGDSDELKIGEWVLAVGNPFNLTSTVTAGIVSAKARSINALNREFAIESFIQTDAAVNPGNSGGALVNKNGKLVGINTAIASRTGYFSGYSFAVPVNIAKKVVADIIEYGTVQRAMLGISIMDIDAELAKEYELDKIEGVYVAGVLTNGAADEAGIQEADVILKIDGHIIHNVAELQEQISRYRPGDEIEVTIKRDGIKKKISAILKNKHGNTDIVPAKSSDILGAVFQELNETEKQRLEIQHGVKVVELFAGKFLKAGIRKNFIITHINREPVYTIGDVKNIMENADGGVYIEGLYPDGTSAYYAFGVK